KIAATSSHSGRDVSGRGVQIALLKLLEETEVPVRNPADIQSQIKALMDFQRQGRIVRESINTRNILFIMSGAFTALPQIISRRLRKSLIGFGAHQQEIPDNPALLLHFATTPDFVEFGFEPEFIGRLPVRVACSPLSDEDLYKILRYSEGSILKQYEKSFAAYGIELTFDDEALRAIASLASAEQTGARGLISICEKLLLEFKFLLPGSGVTKFHVTKEVVENPAAALEKLLLEGKENLTEHARSAFRQLAAEFSARTGIPIIFPLETQDKLVQKSLELNLQPRKLFEQIFKNYEHGLKLALRKEPSEPIPIPEWAIENPEVFLSEVIVSSYQEEKGSEVLTSPSA
ncbi:MAG: AAA family ATPase, partial [Chthoniobacterales bacterium]|nr:AAA family ATPase [Chthoniobacterales bacterium]